MTPAIPPKIHRRASIPKAIFLRITGVLPATAMPTGGITPLAPIVTPQRIGESIYGKYEKKVLYETMVILFVLPDLLVAYDRGDQ